MKRDLIVIVCIQALLIMPQALAQNGPSTSNSYQTDLENIYKRYMDKAKGNDFAELYSKLTRGGGKIPDNTLQNAQSDEAQGLLEAATAGYLAAAQSFLTCGSFEKAKPLLDKVAKVAGQLETGPKTAVIDVLVKLAGMSYTFHEQRYVGADYLLTMALMLQGQRSRTDETSASILKQLAAVRASQSQYTSAISLYQQAIAWYEANNKDSTDLQSCYENLAAVYMKQGDQAAAAALLQKTIDMLEKKSAIGGIDALPFLLRLNAVYQQAKKPEQATEAQERALNIVEKLSAGPLDRRQLALALSAVESIRSSMGVRLSYGELAIGSTQERANPLMERALRIGYSLKVKSDGLNVWTLQYLHDLCSYLARTGKTDEALALYQTALKYAAPNDSTQLRGYYLDLLKTSHKTAEANELEATLARERQEKRVKAEADANQRLVAARAKKEVDPQVFVGCLMAVANFKLSGGQTAESLVLAKEALRELEAIPAADLEDDYQSQFWSYVGGYLARATTKADELSALSLVETLEKLKAKRKERYSSGELSDLVNHFTGRHRYSDAETFLRTVLEYRKKYRPKDVDAQIEALEALSEVYQESEEGAKEKALRAELLALKESLYQPNDPRLVNLKVAAAANQISEGKLKEAEALLSQLGSNTSQAGSKSTEMCRRVSELGTTLVRLAEAYIANNQLADGERVLKKVTEQENSEAGSAYRSMERLVDVYVQKQNFTEAENLIKFQLSQNGKTISADDLSMNKKRLRLAEILTLHANKAAADGKTAEARAAEEEAKSEFAKAISSIEKNQGVNSSEAQEARRKRDKPMSKVEEKQSPLQQTVLSLTERRHRPDVANQDLSRAPDPFTFAIFGRSEVRLAGRASTWSYKSGQPQQQLFDNGGACGTLGEIVLEDQARVHGSVIGRDVRFNQNQILVTDKIDASGNIPEPVPLSPPPTLTGKIHKAAVISNGEINPGKDEITDLGDLTLSPGSTLTLAPGDYTATQLWLQSQCKLVRKKVEGNSQPVRIFAGSKTDSSTKTPLRVSGTSAVNSGGTPAQFQIFYAGDGALVIDEGASVNCIVYAPDALISVGGNDTIVRGCIVADEVRVGGTARVVFDKDMPKSDSLGIKAIDSKYIDSTLGGAQTNGPAN